MIAKLTGLLDSAAADSAVIDVNGVGYLVFASAKTLGALGPAGAAAVLHIETQVREDAIHLFGFVSADERDWFRLLLSVQGVGGRVALAILSVLAPPELHHAVAAKDTASIARANGVGPKLAARIVLELKDKAGSVALSPGIVAPLAKPGTAVSDALSALANLGFRPMDASRAVAEAVAEVGDAAAVGELVRVALRKSAR
ncbi:Holliday junction branch migration protein RuvA [Polymorphobacter sp. PAMC 29334]|uniref:Holliday junction branch migration protein RuvA n=1 Tax=Polymorphobacter sp. PAMC 29334 TaxID=2862331 RepID=UPI001C78E14F|nr:Holliday junction branch migration protein RuvA [Polymorphobacter sp. PAMC 29334]QYE35025.1 Holliday junction branch migration protein RuvA [Polymorphobacter sp. PAMC 29334]